MNKTRLKVSVAFIVSAALTTAIVGLIISIPFHSIRLGFYIAFWMFGMIGVSASALILLTGIQCELAFGFGLVLYYGTYILAQGINKLKWYIPDTGRYILSFIIVSLVLYIVWLRSFKDY